jgi:branched-chain amino acid transport system substrate-binding protein
MQEDFTTQISEFKKAGCELAVGSPPPPDFANFWKQCLQQKFQPKIVSMGMALLFPQTLEAVGPSACNVIVECPWHPAFPYVSSLTGETCRQLADDYESKTGLQWTPPLGIYGLYEWAVDVLKRAADIDDKETIVAAITSTNLETLYAKIDFSTPSPGPKRPVQNVAVGSMCGGQWVKGKGKWQFDLEIVSNVLGPDLPITAEMQPMRYE